MKKTCAIFLATALFSTSIFAQLKVNQPKINIVKSNPFMLLWGSMPFTSETRLAYEFEAGKKQTIMLCFSHYTQSPFLKWNESPKGSVTNNWVIRGFRFQVAKKYYFGKQAHSAMGKYTGFLFSHTDAKYSPYQYHIKGTRFNYRNTYLCWIVGKQRKWMDVVTVDMYCGIGYKNTNIAVTYWNGKQINYYLGDEIDDILLSHLKACAGFNLGYSF